MTLLEETIGELKDNGKTVKDVSWVGCLEFKTTWENFQNIADIEYDNGFGGQEIAIDLLIVGDNFWLERHEDRGAEWWEFKYIPEKPETTKHIYRISGGTWYSLKELNKNKE